MKAERRHELKSNSLARGLEGMPAWGRRYGSHAVTVVLVILLIVLGIQWWQKRSQAQTNAAATALDDARRAVRQMGQLKQFALLGAGAAQDAFPGLRDTLTKSAELGISSVLDNTTNPNLRSQALDIRGDLNWELAHMPVLTGAQTRPALQSPESPESYLKKAEQAYQQVVNADNAPIESVIVARMGLAAIAEERQQWDAAQKSYEAVVENSAVPQAFKTVAVDRLATLVNLRRPALLAELPATQSVAPESMLDALRDLRQDSPSSQPSGGLPITLPSATTEPAAPATTQATTAPSL